MNLFSGYCQVTSADTIIATVEQFAKEIIYQDQDTNYIKSYSDKLSVKLLLLNKFNYFQLTDNYLNNSIRFRPDLGVNLGIGIAYKGLALDLSANFGLKENQIDNTDYRDFQIKAFSSKHYLRGRYQYYSGYKIESLGGFDLYLSDEVKKRRISGQSSWDCSICKCLTMVNSHLEHLLCKMKIKGNGTIFQWQAVLFSIECCYFIG
jgi:hypothetical protein